VQHAGDRRSDRVDIDVPLTLKNWNFAKNAVACGVIASLLWRIDDHSSGSLQGLGVGLLAVFAVCALVQAASWWMVTLRLEWDTIVVGGLFVRRRLRWCEIESFSIRAPHNRTRFMLTFRWWGDQARLRRTSGGSLRIRAIQPRHGFTGLTYYRVRGDTHADRIVAALNELLRRRMAFDDDQGPSPVEVADGPVAALEEPLAQRRGPHVLLKQAWSAFLPWWCAPIRELPREHRGYAEDRLIEVGWLARFLLRLGIAFVIVVTPVFLVSNLLVLLGITGRW
jgi:hypothetical protein